MRRAADRLLAGAGREEPAAGPGRRRRRDRGRGRGRGPASPTPVSCASRPSGSTSPSRCCAAFTSAFWWRGPGAAARSVPSTTSTTWAALSMPVSSNGSSQHVEDAKAKGATVLTGGRRRPDLGELFYEPTVLTGVTPEMDCYAGETFGPLVSIYPVADEAEAIARANDSEYGLNASVWTSDPERGRRVAEPDPLRHRQRQRGRSRPPSAASTRPMGGMKHSGLGRRQGREGIRRFVEVQSIGDPVGAPDRPEPRVHGQDVHRRDDRCDAGAQDGRSRLRRLPCTGRGPRVLPVASTHRFRRPQPQPGRTDFAYCADEMPTVVRGMRLGQAPFVGAKPCAQPNLHC